MAAILIQPVWNRALNRFYNRTTGRILSGDVASAFLRSSGGAFRDVLGRHVPSRFLGGDVIRQFATGDATIAGVNRAVGADPTTIPVRSRDIISGTVSWRDAEGVLHQTDVAMPRGREFDQDIFDERFAGRRAIRDPDDYSKILEYPEAEVVDIEWRITSQYKEGEYLSEDLYRFRG